MVQIKSILADIKSGKQKKNPEKNWTGLAVSITTADGVVFSGMLFPEQKSMLRPVEMVK